MTEKELSFFKGRIEELSKLCERRAIPTHSLFLNMEEQAVLQGMRLNSAEVRVSLSGGVEAAERKIVCFLPPYAGEIPERLFAFLKISPVAAKFAGQLSHRDFLGALTGLGIRRELIGDILMGEGEQRLSAYVVVMSEIAPYIRENLRSVRSSSVSVELVEAEQIETASRTELQDVNVASLRIDALLAAVFRCSRTGAGELLSAGRVYVNSALRKDGAAQLQEGDILSVRGKGRFQLMPGLRRTRSGRLYVQIKKYL